MSGNAPGQAIFLDIPAVEIAVEDEFEHGKGGEWCRVGHVGHLSQKAVMLVTAMGNRFPFAIPGTEVLHVKRIVPFAEVDEHGG